MSEHHRPGPSAVFMCHLVCNKGKAQKVFLSWTAEKKAGRSSHWEEWLFGGLQCVTVRRFAPERHAEKKGILEGSDSAARRVKGVKGNHVSKQKGASALSLYHILSFSLPGTKARWSP